MQKVRTPTAAEASISFRAASHGFALGVDDPEIKALAELGRLEQRLETGLLDIEHVGEVLLRDMLAEAGDIVADVDGAEVDRAAGVRLDEGAALVEHHVPAAALVGVLAQEIDQQRLREIAVVEAGLACQLQDRAARGIVNLAGVGGQREVGAGLQVGGRQHAVGGILDGDALGLLRA